MFLPLEKKSERRAETESLKEDWVLESVVVILASEKKNGFDLIELVNCSFTLICLNKNWKKSEMKLMRESLSKNLWRDC